MTRRVLVRSALLALVASAALALAPLLPGPTSLDEYRVAAYVSHAAWFALVTALAWSVAVAWPAPMRLLLAGVALSFALVVVLNVADVDIASDVAKLCFGSLAGVAFVRAIERPWWLLPIFLLVPAADAWSVFSDQGVTNQVVERARDEPRWIDWPTIASPVAGVDYEFLGRLGIVDVLFLALMLAATVRWGLGIRRALVLLPTGLLLTTILVIERPQDALPALPLLCVAFLLATGPALVRDARAAWRETRPPADV
ncbi:MAG: hypothetical protein JWM86_628 [Thermoleophilia bacterium]|nr:hypothetical protein [Thermoleophilia bacterium]